MTVAFALLAAGCGRGGSPDRQVAQPATSTARSRPPGQGSIRDQALAYARCIRTHGVPLWPDPDSNGVFEKSKLTPQQIGVGTSQVGTAQRACKSLAPSYPSTPPANVLAQALTFSLCMRTHGAKAFPDPESTGAIRIPHSMESSPAYVAALQFCLHKYGPPPQPNPAP